VTPVKKVDIAPKKVMQKKAAPAPKDAPKKSVLPSKAGKKQNRFKYITPEEVS